MKKLFLLLFTLFFSFFAFASDREISEVELSSPSWARWETPVTGKWASVPKASQYQVKLYTGDYLPRDLSEEGVFDDLDSDEVCCVCSVKTSERTCDFSEYMEEGHSYFFIVRAVPKNSQQAYYTAGEWAVSRNIEAEVGITGGIWRNYLDGKKYETEAGNILTSGWYLIAGHYYFFDEEGYAQTGWLRDGGKDYFLGSDGKMVCGFFEENGNTYCAGYDGALQYGWVLDEPGVWYYFYPESGIMASDTFIDGYYVNAKGVYEE